MRDAAGPWPVRRRDRRDRRRGSTDDPVKLSESLRAVSERLGGPRPDVLTAVFGRWEEVVGASMAAHVRPVRLHDDALVVAVDHPAWASQVRHLTPEILDRVRDACGSEHAPARLEIRVTT
ncbi:MAG TPA: DUF721 domain-containing protein [Acidimicrobiales bacterium]|nr:DUF721 domain-containing protein [Acidimicrobiales bacterium]